MILYIHYCPSQMRVFVIKFMQLLNYHYRPLYNDYTYLVDHRFHAVKCVLYLRRSSFFGQPFMAKVSNQPLIWCYVLPMCLSPSFFISHDRNSVWISFIHCGRNYYDTLCLMSHLWMNDNIKRCITPKIATISTNIEAKWQLATTRVKAANPVCLSYPSQRSSQLLRHLT